MEFKTDKSAFSSAAEVNRKNNEFSTANEVRSAN